MRREGLPLYGLESGDPIADFDVIGFSLGYEMAYTNVLNMLDLAGLPLRSEDRDEDMPLIIAGGTCAYNPEPLAPFVDIFSLGEGEDVTVELIALSRRARREGWQRCELLAAAARIPGLYVPSLYRVTYREDGAVSSVTPLEGAPELVTKRIVQDLNQSYFPVKTIVPSTEIVHDRVMLEVFRGCIRGCRFCQAGRRVASFWCRRDGGAVRSGCFRFEHSGGIVPTGENTFRLSHYKVDREERYSFFR